MESSKVKFANDLNIGVEWKEEGDKVVSIFNSSDDFSNACAKLERISYLDELDEQEELNLFGARFVWNGYTDDEQVYTVQAIGDFTTDEYKIEVQ